MVAKKKDVALLRHRRCAGLGRERSLFEGDRIFAKEYLIDFRTAEARDIDRRLLDDQLFEFDLEVVEAPGALFCKPVRRDAQDTLLGTGEMIDSNAGNAGKAQLLGRLNSRHA